MGTKRLRSHWRSTDAIFLDYPYAPSVYITVLVPEDEISPRQENQSAMYATIDAKKGEDKQIKEYIDENIFLKKMI